MNHPLILPHLPGLVWLSLLIGINVYTLFFFSPDGPCVVNYDRACSWYDKVVGKR